MKKLILFPTIILAIIFSIPLNTASSIIKIGGTQLPIKEINSLEINVSNKSIIRFSSTLENIFQRYNTPDWFKDMLSNSDANESESIWLIRIAFCESNYCQQGTVWDLKSYGSNARGLFQFMRSTFEGKWNKHNTGSNWLDPQSQFSSALLAYRLGMKNQWSCK